MATRVVGASLNKSQTRAQHADSPAVPDRGEAVGFVDGQGQSLIVDGSGSSAVGQKKRDPSWPF
ncbi:hypothetical protein PZ897_04605 [Hoeflea sp. YIM 152468]|uniref:hypothetical protein n=1 Tax=Hoeflea sp. YIM 152468 TaxID=3031759 RepID=UPI0023DCA9F2|nr:hypothetical protein [Hoeflea sp. YIM 152468]MDF1607449.1 hypothetical protein [Hoeflea sp. YIM 152468]